MHKRVYTNTHTCPCMCVFESYTYSVPPYDMIMKIIIKVQADQPASRNCLINRIRRTKL